MLAAGARFLHSSCQRAGPGSERSHIPPLTWRRPAQEASATAPLPRPLTPPPPQLTPPQGPWTVRRTQPPPRTTRCAAERSTGPQHPRMTWRPAPPLTLPAHCMAILAARCMPLAMLHSWAASTGMSPHRPLLLAALAKKKKKICYWQRWQLLPASAGTPWGVLSSAGPCPPAFRCPPAADCGQHERHNLPRGFQGRAALATAAQNDAITCAEAVSGCPQCLRLSARCTAR